LRKFIETMVIVAACSCIGASQIQNRAKGTPAAELQIKILPDRRAYSIGDSITSKIEFKNLSGETLCFPEPAQGWSEDAQGSLSTKAIPPGESEQDKFLDHYDGGGTWPREKLIEEIKGQWIWINAGGTYTSKPVQPVTRLDKLGRWELKSDYVPPQGAFNPEGFRKYIGSAARTAGCVVPETMVSAESVYLTVSP
jgi:hypothetical protein